VKGRRKGRGAVGGGESVDKGDEGRRERGGRGVGGRRREVRLRRGGGISKENGSPKAGQNRGGEGGKHMNCRGPANRLRTNT